MGKKAVWIIGHGSSRNGWVESVDHLIESVHSSNPLIISFLEKVEGRLIADGIEQLRKMEVNQVFVLPLFVSSGSTHIAEIQEIVSQYRQEFHFEFGSCMDDHPLVVEHILNQVAELAGGTGNESILLIGHGSDEDSFQSKWQEILQSLTKQIRERTKFSQIVTATFLPNKIIERLQELKPSGTHILVIPLFLSKGVFTERRIPEMIQGYPVKYNGKAYLPNHWIIEWIQEQINQYKNHCEE
ncbi:CbiX/SirB N-terminal domain-containing protein [Tepidibacillus marianensis]|uniref:sirohydrochlorin chelatase n=1 Tax=Tepidibacillus marianensis TaxID=3131995 RepID=UPI0030CBB184